MPLASISAPFAQPPEARVRPSDDALLKRNFSRPSAGNASSESDECTPSDAQLSESESVANREAMGPLHHMARLNAPIDC